MRRQASVRTQGGQPAFGASASRRALTERRGASVACLRAAGYHARVLRRIAMAGLLASGCNNQPVPPPPPPAGFVIIIEHFAYTPASIAVPPGATILVVNHDVEPHSVTSEAAPGLYEPGGVADVQFDTQPFQDGAGPRLLTIPADVPDGTVVPFYCTVHRGSMLPPDGNITVSRAAGP